MLRRSCLFALLVSLAAGSALAQTPAPEAPTPAPKPPRRPRKPRQRQATATTTTPEPLGQPAPVPNRDVEAPRGLHEPPRARLSPTMIDPAPAQPHLGRSGFAVQTQEDRLIRNPAPGARLSVPF